MIFFAHKLTHISKRYSQSFRVIKAVICAKALSGDSCYWRSRKSDRPQLNCSVTAATSQHLKVNNCAAELLLRASKAAQCFCILLQLVLSCWLASKMPLNSCDLAVQLCCSDFVALYSAASFVREAF